VEENKKICQSIGCFKEATCEVKEIQTGNTFNVCQEHEDEVNQNILIEGKAL